MFAGSFFQSKTVGSGCIPESLQQKRWKQSLRKRALVSGVSVAEKPAVGSRAWAAKILIRRAQCWLLHRNWQCEKNSLVAPLGAAGWLKSMGSFDLLIAWTLTNNCMHEVFCLDSILWCFQESSCAKWSIINYENQGQPRGPAYCSRSDILGPSQPLQICQRIKLF